MYEHTSKLIELDDPFADIALQIVPADQYIPIEGKINILFTMFEMLDVPESYKVNLAKADYVIVPCRHNKDLFRPYTKRAPYVCGEGIEAGEYQYHERKYPNFASGERFRIYWAGAPNPRKGYHYALELIKHIQNDPRVEIYIKTTFPKVEPSAAIEGAKKMIEAGYNMPRLKDIADGKDKQVYEQYMKAGTLQVHGKHKNILFDTRRVSSEELVELYHKAHVFIFPSMGEGWGLMGNEALATGLPMVAPMITGIRDWYSPKYGEVCRTIIEDIKSENYNFTARSYMPEPKDFIEKTLSLLDRNNYAKALAKAKIGSKHIHEFHTWDKKAKRLFDIIQEIGHL